MNLLIEGMPSPGDNTQLETNVVVNPTTPHPEHHVLSPLGVGANVFAAAAIIAVTAVSRRQLRK